MNRPFSLSNEVVDDVIVNVSVKPVNDIVIVGDDEADVAL